MVLAAHRNPVPANHHSTIATSIHNIIVCFHQLTVIPVVQAHLSEEFGTVVHYLKSISPHSIIEFEDSRLYSLGSIWVLEVYGVLESCICIILSNRFSASFISVIDIVGEDHRSKVQVRICCCCVDGSG